MSFKYKAPHIVQHDNKRFILLGVVALLVLLVTAWTAYSFGYKQAQVGAAPKEIVDELKRKLEALEASRAEVRRKLVMAERISKVDREAIKAVNDQLRQFQEERSTMEEELVFLRGIVSPGKTKEGLRIQNFRLEKDLEAGVFRYKFSVSQALKASITVLGRIHISVQGLRAGKPQTLSLKTMDKNGTASLKMRFRYFQPVEGLLKLPDGFVPEMLTVQVKPTNKSLTALTESFKWEPVNRS